MITQKDSLEFLQEQKDFAFDINYSDPPYALGSEIYIRPDGKFDYKKATDFMNKWDMPTGEYWEEWFEESFRTLKHGGYCVMFGIDRQLPMFQYYAIKAGFQVRQSMYWYFISSFPKASDLSKNLDKNANFFVKGKPTKNSRKGVEGESGNYSHSKEVTERNPQTDLAKKYEGYKYSISPLKQTCETIMVFQKPYKTGSCLHDTLAYENGDETCACFAWNIDGGRVPMSESDKDMLDAKSSKNPTDNYNGKDHQKYGDFALNIATPPNEQGRYPSQTFCDSSIAERLDEQSGLSKSAGGRIGNKDGAYSKLGVSGFTTSFEKGDGGFGDIGGCSKILHKCDYENGEMDLYVYAPKVSKNERNAGCEELDDKHFQMRPFAEQGSDMSIMKNRMNSKSGKNNHPTLKPISLSYRVLKLFKTPNPQKIVYPFAGVQSEVIGGYKAGFTDFSGCELNAEYVDIGNVRFEHWKDKPFDEKGKVVEPKKETKAKVKKEPQIKPEKKIELNEQLKLL
jgi:site-specific DNA-methyltransferase (adenine-specific)